MLMAQLNFGMRLHVSISFFLTPLFFRHDRFDSNITHFRLIVQVQDCMSMLIYILYKIAFVQMYY